MQAVQRSSCGFGDCSHIVTGLGLSLAPLVFTAEAQKCQANDAQKHAFYTRNRMEELFRALLATARIVLSSLEQVMKLHQLHREITIPQIQVANSRSCKPEFMPRFCRPCSVLLNIGCGCQTARQEPCSPDSEADLVFCDIDKISRAHVYCSSHEKASFRLASEFARSKGGVTGRPEQNSPLLPASALAIRAHHSSRQERRFRL